MKKMYFAIAFLIVVSMFITACGSGCKTNDTKEECQARSPIDQPMKQFGGLTDEAMQEANEALTNEVNRREQEMSAFVEQQDQKIQNANSTYTNWATNLAESIFGNP